jgi:hypothetical protein
MPLVVSPVLVVFSPTALVSDRPPTVSASLVAPQKGLLLVELRQLVGMIAVAEVMELAEAKAPAEVRKLLELKQLPSNKVARGKPCNGSYFCSLILLLDCVPSFSFFYVTLFSSATDILAFISTILRLFAVFMIQCYMYVPESRP